MTQPTESTHRPIRVWVDGCFDVVHFGHANAMRQARGMGDYLVVGVHSDGKLLCTKFSIIAFARLEDLKMHKGPPVYNEEERYRLVRAIKWVDEVVEGAPYVTSLATMEEHNCEFTAHGDDVTYTADGSDPYHFVKVAGRYKEFKRTVGISTTELVTRILKRMAKPPAEDGFTSPSLRRTRSVDSLGCIWNHQETTSTKYSCVATMGSRTNDTKCSGDGTVMRTDDQSKNNTTEVLPNWSNCGMSYVPNSLRIMQFSACGSFGLREPREPDDVVVYVPGTFDLFHIGHLEFLEKCLEIGNYLLVGLYSDKSAIEESRRMGTILTLQERLLSVLACRYVCNVVIDAPYHVPASLLDHFKVNHVVVGKDTKLVPSADGKHPMQVPMERGIFRRVESKSQVTTSSLIARILRNRVNYEERNAAKIAREAETIKSLNMSSTCADFGRLNCA